jgi:GNAT superfamily N-acetyltransferase
VQYRPAAKADVPAMARIRAEEWESTEYWQERIVGYLDGTSHPHQSLEYRAAFVAIHDEVVIGFVAGHLTRRYGCTGELQWINVAAAHRGRGIAAGLLRTMAAWFVAQNATYVCVDVDPANASARRLYGRHGAKELNPHWLVWTNIGTVLGEA